MPQKLVLLNDLYPDLDRDMNGDFYCRETVDTGVVYRIENIMNGKSYIGKAFSYAKYANKKLRPYGAKGRFRRHWTNKNSANNDCPIFYEALRNSDIQDWYIYTLKVCPKDKLKKYETELIKKYNTSDPKFGYNYFVGDNKPNNKNILKQYQSKKTNSNIKRASGGAMRKKKYNKNLPLNIYCLFSRKKDGTKHHIGYHLRIKINGNVYTKVFSSNNDSMKVKLDKTKKQLQLFKKTSKNKKHSGSKTNKKINKNYVIEI